MNKNFIFLNGLPVISSDCTIMRGDVIQLIAQIKIQLFIKWNILLFGREVWRFYFYLRKWRKRSFRLFPKQSSRRIPNWIRSYIFFKEPIPVFLEVDFLTTSTLVLYNWTSNFTQYHFTSLNLNSWATTRSLNWKSIT